MDRNFIGRVQRAYGTKKSKVLKSPAMSECVKGTQDPTKRDHNK